jgi:6-pyruvoyltetrahydropterin/6-carboxytetrahydropterin synthase
MFHLGIKIGFDAAHCIRGHQGKCANLHGHRWEVEVVISGNETDSLGMLADFSIIKSRLLEIINKLDHKNLNDLAPFIHINPTAENVAKFIFEELIGKSGKSGIIWGDKSEIPVEVEEVKVWESRDSWASYRP